MSLSIGELFGGILLEDKFSPGTAKIEQNIDKLVKKFSGIGGAAGSATGGLGTFGTEIGKIAGSVSNLGGAFAGLAIGAAVMEVVDFGGAITDMSAQTGIGVIELQRLKYAGDLAGVSLESIVGAVGKMQDNLGSLNAESMRGIRQLGFDINEILQMDPGKQFEMIMTAIGKIEDPSKRAAVAMDIFGRAGIKLLPMANDLEAIGDRAERLGIVMSEKVIAGSDNVGDALTTLSGIGRGVIANALTPLADWFESIPVAIEETRKDFEAIGITWADVQGVAKELTTTVEVLKGELGSMPTVKPINFYTPPTAAGGLSMKELNQLADDLTKQVKESIEVNKKAAREAEAHAEAIDRLRESLSGQGAIKAVKDMQEALKGTIPISKMTREAQDQINEVAAEAIEVYRAQGKVAPEAVRQLYAETLNIRNLGPDIILGLKGSWESLGQQIKLDTEYLTYFYEIHQRMGTLEPLTSLPGENIGLPEIPEPPDPVGFQQIRQEIGGINNLLRELDRVTEGSMGSWMDDLLRVADAWMMASDAADAYAGATNNVQKAMALAQGAMATWQAAGAKSKGAAIGGGALAGMQAGMMFGPYGAAIGAAAGAITGWIRSRHAGRDFVEAFAEDMGGFDAIHEKLNELPNGEELWIKLTQRVPSGDENAAMRAVEEVNRALEEQKQKVEEAADAAVKAQEEISAAQEEAKSRVNDRIADLTREYDQLFNSIKDEAPEEVMGVIEAETRARMEQVAQERKTLEEELQAMLQSVSETEVDPVVVPVRYEVEGDLPPGVGGIDSMDPRSRAGFDGGVSVGNTVVVRSPIQLDSKVLGESMAEVYIG